MKVGELIESLKRHNQNQDIKIVIRAKGYYEITDIEIGNHIGDGSRCPDYVRLVASNWDVKRPGEASR